jgi:hypothetical protein
MCIKKLVLFNLLWINILPLFAQNDSVQVKSKLFAKQFVLTIQSYNHAEMLGNGMMSLKMTEKYLELTNIPYLRGDKKRVVFSKKVSKYDNSIIQLSQLNLDTLKSFYYNKRVMLTSGYECYFKYKNKKNSKEIRMHHYYLKLIDEIIQLVNLSLPTEYQFNYLPADTEQEQESM